jgi:hypothetical protein
VLLSIVSLRSTKIPPPLPELPPLLKAVLPLIVQRVIVAGPVPLELIPPPSPPPLLSEFAVLSEIVVFVITIGGSALPFGPK